MATPAGVTPGAATLLTFARKRPRDADTAVGAAKRVRVSPAGGEGGTHGGASQHSPWARVRSGRQGQQGACVERTLFAAPDAVPRERTALAPSRSANSGGSGLAVLVDKAPVQRRGAGRGAAGAGLRDKVDFFRAVDQEELVEEEEGKEQPRSALAALKVILPSPSSARAFGATPAAAPPVHRPGSLLRPRSVQPPAPPPSRATTTGVAGPSPLYRRGLPPRRLAADPRPQGVDADASVFQGASPSVRALWNARAAAAPVDMPRVRIPGGDVTGPDGADAESPAPGEARLPRVQATGGGQLRVPMGPPVADAGVAAAAAVGDDDIEHDSVLGAPPETWCDTWPGGRNPAASSVAEATAIQATMQRVSIGGEAAQPQMPHGAGSPAGTGSGGVYTLLMNAAKADAAEHASRMRLPPGYTVRELNCFEEAPELHALNKAFAAEDDRIGILPARGPCGNAHGCVSLLVYGETARAVGYALHYPNAVPSWRGAGAAAADDMSALPPRLAHLYILPSHRRAGLGTALLAWWRARHAATVALFAVDTPNDAMTRCLTRLGCAPATQASGFDAQAVHYVGAPHQQPLAGGRQ